MSTAAKRLLNLEHLAARVMTIGEFLAFVREVIAIAERTVNPTDCARLKEAIVEGLAREMKIDVADMRAALLGAEAGN